MKTSVLLVFSFVLPLISAQVPHWGPCPEPDVQPGFSLKQVKGLFQCVGCHSRITLPSSVGSKWKAKTCFLTFKNRIHRNCEKALWIKAKFYVQEIIKFSTIFL